MDTLLDKGDLGSLHKIKICGQHQLRPVKKKRRVVEHFYYGNDEDQELL